MAYPSPVDKKVKSPVHASNSNPQSAPVAATPDGQVKQATMTTPSRSRLQSSGALPASPTGQSPSVAAAVSRFSLAGVAASATTASTDSADALASPRNKVSSRLGANVMASLNQSLTSSGGPLSPRKVSPRSADTTSAPQGNQALCAAIKTCGLSSESVRALTTMLGHLPDLASANRTELQDAVNVYASQLGALSKDVQAKLKNALIEARPLVNSATTVLPPALQAALAMAAGVLPAQGEVVDLDQAITLAQTWARAATPANSGAASLTSSQPPMRTAPSTPVKSPAFVGTAPVVQQQQFMQQQQAAQQQQVSQQQPLDKEEAPPKASKKKKKKQRVSMPEIYLKDIEKAGAGAVEKSSTGKKKTQAATDDNVSGSALSRTGKKKKKTVEGEDKLACSKRPKTKKSARADAKDLPAGKSPSPYASFAADRAALKANEFSSFNPEPSQVFAGMLRNAKPLVELLGSNHTLVATAAAWGCSKVTVAELPLDSKFRPESQFADPEDTVWTFSQEGVYRAMLEQSKGVAQLMALAQVPSRAGFAELELPHVKQFLQLMADLAAHVAAEKYPGQWRD
ncbi:MAG: hypothetical protein JWP36_235 [Paucimonas sp.]|nr:hypothetical protein [Paucimonas sp.]